MVRKGTHWRTITSILDREGRFVILHGILRERTVTLVNVYGLNVNDPDLFWSIWHIVIGLAPSAVMWGVTLM